MTQEIKTEEYDDVAKRVSRTLYQDLQRSPDEPLSITVLISHLKHRMGWDDEQITKLQQEMNLNSSSIDYQDIVQYLSTHNAVAQDMQQYFVNHSISNMPKIASYSNQLKGHHTVSSYFLQPPADLRIQTSGPMFMQPQYYLYDQTTGIPLRGTTDRQGGGTLYQNPLYHGSLAFASPTGTPYKLAPRKSVTTSQNEIEVEFDEKTESITTSDGALSSKEDTRKTVDMESWVRYHSGNRVIRKLLIANNGIAAVKCMKYVRMWCYSTFGDLNAIHFVCMATPEDISSNAEYIRMADEVVAVPGGSNNYNYANVTIIITIAKQSKCDAVWPGWGHASEYPSLPRQLAEAGIGWIGPDADAMYASGDKIMSTLIAQYAGVPTVPWSGSNIKVKYGNDEQLNAAFKKSCINSLSEAIECADGIGYPVMIKASEGGGGKGIRKCIDRNEMSSAYSQVCAEVPGSPIFIMKLASNARHLEVQLLGDEWGNVIALFGRDCSMQRRHQKIIEEGPIINVDPQLLLEMEASAVALAKSVHYVGAGTVEFLYDNDSKRYFFLELNPRLQVEHPVTELISGINLPAAQVMVAMGVPLHCMDDIRSLYGEEISSTAPFELSCSNRNDASCHAIACRITAENPLNNFTPTSGLISELHFRSSPNVWGYFSLKTASSIHDYADSQFGHIFASGQTRDDARKAMVLALSELEIRGGNIRTTIEFLSSILCNDEYISGTFHTTWLESQLKGRDIIRVPSHLSPSKIVLLGAVASGHKSLNEIESKLLSDLEHGRNINGKKYRDHLVQCPVELIYKNVKYRILIEKTSSCSYTCRYRKWKCDVVVRNLSDSGLLVSLDGRSHVLYGSWNAVNQLVLCCDGHTVEFEQEYDPSSIKAAIPGKLVKILCGRGQHVLKGESFAEIEVMKMYMPLIVPESGIIDVIAQEGSILQIGQEIATLKLDNMEQIKKAEVFTGDFAQYSSPEKVSVRVDRKFIAAHHRIKNMLDGYCAATDIDHEYVTYHLDLMMNALRDPALPLDEFNSALEPLHGRIDENLYNKLKNKTKKYSENLAINRFRWEKTEVFPSESILANITAFKQTLSSSADIATFESTIDPLRSVCNRHRRGTHFYAVEVISNLLETFCLRESRFIDQDENIVIQQLRREAPNNLQQVAVIVRSHFQLKHRESVIMELLNIAESIFENRMYEFILELTHILETMTSLTDIKYGKIHLKAREILASIDVSSESQRKMEIENMLKAHSSSQLTKSSSSSSLTLNQQRRMGNTKDIFNDEGLLHTIPDLLEILPKYLLSETQNVACNAVELWIRSVFAPPFYFVDKKSMSIKWKIDESTQCSFSFNTINPKDKKDIDILHKNKMGFFGFFANLSELKRCFASIIDCFPRKESLPVHAIILGFHSANLCEKSFTISMEKYLTPFRSQLNECGISFISVFVPSTVDGSTAPHLFTFRYMLDFREDPMTRHIMPPLVTMLEMDRLKMGFQIQWMPTENRRIHIFEAVPMKKRLFTRNWDGKRLFARVPVAQMVKPQTMIDDILSDYYRFGGPEFALMEATHALDSIISSTATIYRYNHILLACFFDADFDVIDSEYDFDDKSSIRKWKKRVFNYIYNRINHDYLLFAKQLKRLHVTHIEIRFQIRISHKNGDFAPYIFRAFLDEPGNGVINIHVYVEKTSLEDGTDKLIDPQYDKTKVKGRLHGTAALSEHIVEHNLMAQRITAKNLGTTYVYDWPILFEKALQNIWSQHKYKCINKQVPLLNYNKEVPFQNENDHLITFEEYAIDKKLNKLIKIERAPGQNDVAMVIWKVTMKTPEFVSGRQIIIASNDIANNLGTFSLAEDEAYNMACNWAQEEGLPFIYLSANSGARIGLSQQLMNKFKVKWGEKEPKYLYLDEETYNKLERKDIVNVEKVCDNEYKIVDIIGKYGIGVENLSGSGLIAGTTSRASFNTFTLSYVTGRSVGIGAYLVRLTQRIIQKVDSPILLTGYVALNNLLGKSVYLSNQQIGGASEVMMPNGISHYVVNDDLEGAFEILKWLSYIPCKRGEAYPIEDNLVSLHDPIDRDVAYYPSSDKYDVRCLIAGDIVIDKEEEDTKDGDVETKEETRWISGLFDRDSFTEYLSLWATSVVIGRARLGGIPVGIIATETRTTQCVIPPDPALEDESFEISFSQPGQVWYPDSSFKTSQAIRDFSGEELPLFILANWRGFSGGQRDMFHSILKYGSYIVDELADYKQPVFIYLPPTAELRGGAWVVLDSLINDRVIEMYSAENAKANVLEPTGTIGLKFRKKKLLQTMHRCDPHLNKLNEKLKKIEKLSPNNQREIQEINKEIENRERGLFPIYNKIALMYAKLHDTPQRMKDVGVIKNVVEWTKSRRYFYWRLRKKLIILNAINDIITLNGSKWKDAKKEFDQFIKNNHHDEDDKAFVEWFKLQTKQYQNFKKHLKEKSIKNKLKNIINQFKGNKKELKDVFNQLIQSDIDIDVVNID